MRLQPNLSPPPSAPPPSPPPLAGEEGELLQQQIDSPCNNSTIGRCLLKSRKADLVGGCSRLNRAALGRMVLLRRLGRHLHLGRRHLLHQPRMVGLRPRRRQKTPPTMTETSGEDAKVDGDEEDSATPTPGTGCTNEVGHKNQVRDACQSPSRVDDDAEPRPPNSSPPPGFHTTLPKSGSSSLAGLVLLILLLWSMHLESSWPPPPRLWCCCAALLLCSSSVFLLFRFLRWRRRRQRRVTPRRLWHPDNNHHGKVTPTRQQQQDHHHHSRPSRRRKRKSGMMSLPWWKLGPNLWLTPLLLSTLFIECYPSVESAKLGGFSCEHPSTANMLSCLPVEYSKFDLPIERGTMRIGVTIDIDEVLRINDKDYSITFSSYFNVKWWDQRIHLKPEFGREQAGPGVNVTNNPNILVPINLEFVKDLWLPNIFIYNLKTYKVIDVLTKLAGLWIGADKSVLYSQATHITFICPMRFDKFPLDSQSCKFQVGSYSYDDSKMIFITERAGYLPPKTENSIALDYDIEIKNLAEEDQVFLGDASIGNFSLAGFEMVLHRYVSTYIITYYLPSGLFVIVSWISFLIPMDVIPGRMALLVTLFLVLVNIFNTVTTNTPKAEGLTAIEAWMLACILFVFGALIEYAAILFKKQRYVSATHRMNIKIVCKDNFKYEVQERHNSAHAQQTSAVSIQTLAEEYWRIDKFFLISFPILFFIFNIIYWLAFIF